MRRRTALPLVLIAAALGLAAAGCGGEETKTATPDTTEGTLPTQTTTTETETTTVEGDATAGKAIFTGSAGCSGCHTLADANATGTVGPNLDEAKPSDARVVDRVTNGRGVMPSFKGQLTEQQIADVAAYVSSVAGQ
jgi:mono/diheme cytochrome c family protein